MARRFAHLQNCVCRFVFVARNIVLSYSNVQLPIYQIIIIVPTSPFSGPNSSDIHRRVVVVRASSAAKLRVSSAITTFFTVGTD